MNNIAKCSNFEVLFLNGESFRAHARKFKHELLLRIVRMRMRTELNAQYLKYQKKCAQSIVRYLVGP